MSVDTQTPADTQNTRETQFASIVPLDYGEGRREYSIVYTSHDWSVLVPLLLNPAKFMLEANKDWTEIPAKETERPIPWKLLSPVSILMEWAGNSPDAFVKSVVGAGATSPAGPKVQAEVLGGSIRAVSLEALDHAHDPTKIRQKLDRLFPDGLIVAEFAVDTHTLMLRYHPPVKESPSYRGDKPRFDPENFTKATLVSHNEEGNPGMGSFHFDIGKTAELRAAFVADYIENWAEMMNKALFSKGISTGFARTAPRWGSIKVSMTEPPAAAASPSQVKITPSPLFPFPTVLIDAARTVAPQDAGEDCQICVENNGVFVDPHVLIPGTTIVKCYVQPA